MGVGQSQVSIIKEVSLNIYVEKSSNKSIGDVSTFP